MMIKAVTSCNKNNNNDNESSGSYNFNSLYPISLLSERYKTRASEYFPNWNTGTRESSLNRYFNPEISNSYLVNNCSFTVVVNCLYGVYSVVYSFNSRYLMLCMLNV
jgi:hypothetical protein